MIRAVITSYLLDAQPALVKVIAAATTGATTGANTERYVGKAYNATESPSKPRPVTQMGTRDWIEY